VKRDRAQRGCDWIQHSIKQANYSAVDTCFDDDGDVAHASPFKWDCHQTCTESLHTGNNAGLVNMRLKRGQCRSFGIFKLFEVKIVDFRHLVVFGAVIVIVITNQDSTSSRLLPGSSYSCGTREIFPCSQSWSSFEQGRTTSMDFFVQCAVQ
jgi:hypothetical protein